MPLNTTPLTRAGAPRVLSWRPGLHKDSQFAEVRLGLTRRSRARQARTTAPALIVRLPCVLALQISMYSRPSTSSRSKNCASVIAPLETCSSAALRAFWFWARMSRNWPIRLPWIRTCEWMEGRRIKRGYLGGYQGRHDGRGSAATCGAQRPRSHNKCAPSQAISSTGALTGIRGAWCWHEVIILNIQTAGTLKSNMAAMRSHEKPMRVEEKNLHCRYEI